MRKKILLFGLLLLTTNFCCAEQPAQINNGRFVIYQHPTFRGDQYLLDTKTGKIWEMAKSKDGTTIWQQVLFDCYNDDKTYAGRFVNPR